MKAGRSATSQKGCWRNIAITLVDRVVGLIRLHLSSWRDHPQADSHYSKSKSNYFFCAVAVSFW
jgi:hypothetical protein